jgi:hypothetical protein
MAGCDLLAQMDGIFPPLIMQIPLIFITSHSFFHGAKMWEKNFRSLREKRKYLELT